MSIVIQELKESDNLGEWQDKINTNFDQIHLAGGGPPGPKGPRGFQGVPGPQGKRGSIWVTGSTSGSYVKNDKFLKSNGDVYNFDGTNFNLTGVNLKGATGATGPKGETLLKSFQGTYSGGAWLPNPANVGQTSVKTHPDFHGIDTQSPPNTRGVDSFIFGSIRDFEDLSGVTGASGHPRMTILQSNYDNGIMIGKGSTHSLIQGVTGPTNNYSFKHFSRFFVNEDWDLNIITGDSGGGLLNKNINVQSTGRTDIQSFNASINIGVDGPTATGSDISFSVPGGVGIGYTKPKSKLSINGSLGVQYNDPNISGAAAFNGDVGIGTTGPSYRLQVMGTSYSEKIYINQDPNDSSVNLNIYGDSSRSQVRLSSNKNTIFAQKSSGEPRKILIVGGEAGLLPPPVIGAYKGGPVIIKGGTGGDSSSGDGGDTQLVGGTGTNYVSNVGGRAIVDGGTGLNGNNGDVLIQSHKKGRVGMFHNNPGIDLLIGSVSGNGTIPGIDQSYRIHTKNGKTLTISNDSVVDITYYQNSGIPSLGNTTISRKKYGYNNSGNFSPIITKEITSGTLGTIEEWHDFNNDAFVWFNTGFKQIGVGTGYAGTSENLIVENENANNYVSRFTNKSSNSPGGILIDTIAGSKTDDKAFKIDTPAGSGQVEIQNNGISTINGNTSGWYSLQIKNFSSADSRGVLIDTSANGGNANDKDALIVQTPSESNQFRVKNDGISEVNGTFKINGSAVHTSDKRFKKNIKPINNALSTINKLNPVYYERNESNNKEYGFIAQEVKEILPSVVKNIDDIYNLDYNSIFTLFTKALQEQQNEISSLQQQINDIKNSMNS